MNPGLSELLQGLQRHKLRKRASGWEACCPAHDDKRASLSITQADDGKVLLKCHAGCETEDITASLNLPMAALFPDYQTARRSGPASLTEAVYDYHDEESHLLFQVVRFDGKKFRQRHPDGQGGWIWKMEGVRLVPYRLPDLLSSDDQRTVFIVEGEKDVETLRKHGEVATTNPGGAGKWRDEYANALQGRAVVVLPDNDVVGKNHAEAIAASVARVAASVRVLNLPGLPNKGDVSDWLQAGNTVDHLRSLVDKSPPWAPAQTDTGRSQDQSTERVIALSEVQPEELEWLWPGRIPLGKITILDGDPGLGKSTMVADLAARISTGRPLPGEQGGRGCENVVLITHEDGLGDTVRPRLDAAGANVERVFATGPSFHPTIPEDIDEIGKIVHDKRARLLVIDPLFEYLDPRTDAFRDHHVRTALAPLGNLAARTGVAVLLVRHLRKSGGASALYRGGGSIGIIGVARSGLLLAKDPNDDGHRVVASVKSNLGPPPPSLSWRFRGGKEQGIEWLGEVSVTADQLVNLPVDSPEEGGALQQAAKFLGELLAPGPVPANDVFAEAEAAGISKPTLRRAADRLGVQRSKSGFCGNWNWCLSKVTNTNGRSSSDQRSGASPPNNAKSEAISPTIEGDHPEGDQPHQITFSPGAA